jgi:Ca2+-binding RTX toxin-like protein
MRRALLLVFPLALSVVATTPASAGTTSDFASGTLTVNGSVGADEIRVECVDGGVQVNGSAPSGAPACSAVQSIVVRAGGGEDRVTLGAVRGGVFTRLGEVRIFGDDGDDTVTGSSLADRIDGGSGYDILRGGSGNDFLAAGGTGGEAYGGKGKDTIYGEGGGDWSLNNDSLVRFDPVNETTLISGIERARMVLGGGVDNLGASEFSGPVTVDGGDGDDLINGGTGPDNLRGGAGDDWLSGRDGNDVLEGEAGNDVLRGDDGNDRHDGGSGDDACLGGVGDDVFISC